MSKPKLSKKQWEVLERMERGDEVTVFWEHSRITLATIANYIYRDERITATMRALIRSKMVEKKFCQLSDIGRDALKERKAQRE